MTEFEFWKNVKEFGQMTYAWWYPTFALPAFIIAISAFALSLFAARKIKKVHNRFLMLFIATVPLILTFPSLYITLQLDKALERVGVTLPENVLNFSTLQSVRVGQALNAFALWGVIGITLTFPILWSGLLVGETGGPVGRVVKDITKRVTNIATRAFGNRGGVLGPKNSPYGTVTISRGQRKGSIEAVRPDYTMGGKGDIPINDPITSRIHSKFVLVDDVIALQDMGSTNGTYIKRSGQAYQLDGQPVPLMHGDIIYLGDPNMPESIEMLYQMTQGAA